MAYQALYRKWRPKSFDDVVGQEHITETLKRQVMSGRTSHAYLFTGTRGTGKTTCAKILSRAVNCEHPVNGNPCGVCPSCMGIENGSIMDVEELDAASNNGVDNIRQLRESAQYTPTSVRRRVYIVDEVHMLSGAAFNALLKIMEEPPEHLIFVLATTELHKVPATILSRCQRYSFRRISPEAIAARLGFIAREEDFELTPGAANLLARLGDGSMRDAVSLLDQCCTGSTVDEERVYSAVGLAGTLRTAELFRRISRRDSAGAVDLIAELYQDGKDISSLLSELSSLYRDLLLANLAPKGGAALMSGFYDDTTLRELAGTLSRAALMNGLSAITAAEAELSYSTNPRLTAEMCVLKMSDETLSGDVSALTSRIERLETAINNGAVPASAPAQTPARSFERPAVRQAPAVSAPVKTPPADLPWDDSQFSAPVPAPKAEKPAAQPAAKPAEAPAPADIAAKAAQEVPPTAKPIAGFNWAEVVKRTGGPIDTVLKGFLTDSTICTAVFSGGILTVNTKTNFAATMLGDRAIVDELARACGTVVGGAVKAEVLAPGAQSTLSAAKAPAQSPARTPNMDKINQLSRFGNVDIK